jgi:hypothetical protein
MWTTIDTLAMFVLLATVFIIARWRRRGVIASMIIGYLAIEMINVSFAGNTWHDIEALEDWPTVGVAWMPAWSLLIYGAVLLYSYCQRRSKVDGPHGTR